MYKTFISVCELLRLWRILSLSDFFSLFFLLLAFVSVFFFCCFFFLMCLQGTAVMLCFRFELNDCGKLGKFQWVLVSSQFKIYWRRRWEEGLIQSNTGATGFSSIKYQESDISHSSAAIRFKMTQFVFKVQSRQLCRAVYYFSFTICRLVVVLLSLFRLIVQYYQLFLLLVFLSMRFTLNFLFTFIAVLCSGL